MKTLLRRKQIFCFSSAGIRDKTDNQNRVVEDAVADDGREEKKITIYTDDEREDSRVLKNGPPDNTISSPGDFLKNIFDRVVLTVNIRNIY